MRSSTVEFVAVRQNDERSGRRITVVGSLIAAIVDAANMKAAKQKSIALPFAKPVSSWAFSVVMGIAFPLAAAYYTKSRHPATTRTRQNL